MEGTPATRCTEPPKTGTELALCHTRGRPRWGPVVRGEDYNLLLTSDWCHRICSDVLLAIQDVNWQFVIMIWTIVMNLDPSPWAGHKWCAELRAGTIEHTQVADCTDIIFDGNILHIAAESGLLVNDFMNEDGCATLSDSIGEVMTNTKKTQHNVLVPVRGAYGEILDSFSRRWRAWLTR